MECDERYAPSYRLPGLEIIFLLFKKIFFEVRVFSTGSFVAKLGYEKPEKLSEISIKGQKIQKIAFVVVRQIR